MPESNNNIESRIDSLAKRIETLVTVARGKIVSTVNTSMVYTYYEIGKYIVEDEQGGNARAEYGKGILRAVSKKLTDTLGNGWSDENLRLMRKFYLTYSKNQTSGLEIGFENENQTSGLEIQNQISNLGVKKFVLPWTHRNFAM